METLVIGLVFAVGTLTGHWVGTWLESRKAKALYDGGMARMDSLLDDERAKNADLTALLKSDRPQDFAAWKNLLDRPDPEPEGPPVRYLHDEWGFSSEVIDDG